VAEIIAAAKAAVGNGSDDLMAALIAVAEDDGTVSPRRLGGWLASAQNAIAGGLKLLKNSRDTSRIRWQVVPVGTPNG
jgi:hypothetical protein